MPQNRASTYFEQLKFVLEHFDEPLTIGESSPLAAPYFLGQTLRQLYAGHKNVEHKSSEAASRGRTLCSEIEKSVVRLWGEPLPADGKAMMQAVQAESEQRGRGNRYDCLILELNYFKQRYKPLAHSQSEIYNDILHISRASHDRYLAAAVEKLGALLLRQVRPSLRFEQPILQHELVGRADLIEQCLATLQAGKSVTLTGVGGVGKSALGLAIGEAWSSQAIFWFMLRPGVNDSVTALLFALGYFLQQQGASLLWQQLVADNGQIKDLQLASGLAQSDLRGLAQRPLLCFDEIDLLRRLTLDSENPRHTQLLELIETLRTAAPLLLIGQQAVLESDRVIALEGLHLEEVAQWLRLQPLVFTDKESPDQESSAKNITDEDIARLHLYTQGNPRLLELCVALYRSSSGTLRESLDQMPQSPAVSALWQRLQRRLNVAERHLLAELSVFRNPAPEDVWNRLGEDAAAFSSLLDRALLRLDGQGGVYLLPAVREVIYRDLTIETRQQFHLQAASIRTERGEYTAAAYHLLAADQPEQAVTLWFPQRQEEVRRGQAGAALAIFEQISLHRLQGKSRQQMAILRAELYQLLGEPERAEESLRQSDWPAESELAIDAARLWGDALDAQGKTDAARQRYDEGLTRLATLLNRGTQLQVQRGMLHLRQRAVDEAWRDGNLARFQAERLLGAVADQRGDFATAQQHYQTALTIADALQHEPGLAQIQHYLGISLSRQQQMAEAASHFEQAIDYYERIGDRMNREYVRGNLAASYIDAKDFTAAIAAAAKALIFFQQIGDSFSIALNASNLAEAHVQLGHFAEAQHFAEIVLQQEEPHSHPYAFFTLGTVFQKQEKWDEAALHFAQSRKLAELNHDRFLLAYGWRALGEVYAAQGQAKPANHALSEALTLFQEMTIADEIAKTEALIAANEA